MLFFTAQSLEVLAVYIAEQTLVFMHPWLGGKAKMLGSRELAQLVKCVLHKQRS